MRDVVSAAGDGVGLWELCGFCPGVVAQRSSSGAWGGRVKPVKKKFGLVCSLFIYLSCSCTSPLEATYSALQKYSVSVELFHILSHFNHKCKCILLGFYVIDQHKVVHNFEVEGE